MTLSSWSDRCDGVSLDYVLVCVDKRPLALPTVELFSPEPAPDSLSFLSFLYPIFLDINKSDSICRSC